MPYLEREVPHHAVKTSSDLPWVKTGRHLGRGAYSVVQEVKDKENGKTYAQKFFFSNTETVTESYKNELHAVRHLGKHHHIVEVIATFSLGPKYGIILTPIADRGSLRGVLTRINQDGQTTESLRTTLQRTFGCLASGLEFIHHQDVRHKDIKPENILLHGESVLFTDFGTSLVWGFQEQSTTEGTAYGGTRKYYPPEAEAGEETPRNRKSDVFSLGCVFMEMMLAIQPDCVPLAPMEKGFRFSSHLRRLLPALTQRIHESKENDAIRPPSTSSDIRSIYYACFNMLQHNRDDRPTSSEVVQILFAGVGDSDPSSTFCDNCLLQTQRKYTRKNTFLVASQAKAYLRKCAGRSCRRTRKIQSISGIFCCTFGCGFRTDNSDAWKQHETENQPREVWFCTRCPDEATRQYITDSRQKCTHHLTTHHAGIKDIDDAADFSRMELEKEFRRLCGFCGYYFMSWDQRQQHIMDHFQRKLAPCDMESTWQDPWQGPALDQEMRDVSCSREGELDELSSVLQLFLVQIDLRDGNHYQGRWSVPSNHFYVLSEMRESPTNWDPTPSATGFGYRRVKIIPKVEVERVKLCENNGFFMPQMVLTRMHTSEEKQADDTPKNDCMSPSLTVNLSNLEQIEKLVPAGWELSKPVTEASSSISSPSRASSCSPEAVSLNQSVEDRSFDTNSPSPFKIGLEFSSSRDERGSFPPWPTVNRPKRNKTSRKYRRNYPELAAFLEDDQNLLMPQRFQYLHGRLHLDKQNEIVDLGNDLETQESLPQDYKMVAQQMECKKKELEALQVKLIEYEKLFVAARMIKPLRSPTLSEYKGLRNHCDESVNLSNLVYGKEDLATIRRRSKHLWLERVTERILQAVRGIFTQRIFRFKETIQRTNGPSPVYYTRRQIGGFATAIILSMISVHVIVPTYILYCLGVSLVFTSTFSVVMSLCSHGHGPMRSLQRQQRIALFSWSSWETLHGWVSIHETSQGVSGRMDLMRLDYWH